VARASELNPHHPRWYCLAPFANAYRKGDYQAALDAASRINVRNNVGTQVALAASHGQLGDLASARDAVRSLLEVSPDYVAVGRVELGKWFDHGLVEHLVDGLRKAGMPFSS